MREAEAADIIDMAQVVAGPDRGKVCRRLAERLIGLFPEDQRDGMQAECERYMRETKREFWEASNAD